MSDPEIGSDERVFRYHLEQGAFKSGVAKGKWRLIKVDWPNVLIAVSAAKREGAPDEFVFRFNLPGYPTSLPNAQPWSLEENSGLPAARWPTGRNRVPAAFNPSWNSAALYLPCDRLAIGGHEGWLLAHPHLAWSSSDDITKYLNIIYELLNSEDYTGIRGT